MVEARLVIQLGIGVLLLLSSAAKWRNPMTFARGVADYAILPLWLAYPLGLLLIPLESWLAAAHLTGWTLSLAVPVAATMFIAFAVAVAVNIGRGRSLPCYCFGDREGETISLHTLARLCLLLAGEGYLLLSSTLLGGHRLVHQQIKGLPELALAAMWTTVLLLGGMWLLSLGDVVDLLRPCPKCGARRPPSEQVPVYGAQP